MYVISPILSSTEYPEIMEPLDDLTAPDGEPVEFRCCVKGAPPDEVRITWYKGDKEIQDSNEFRQSYDGSVAKLRIAEVFPDDQDIYRCVILTDNGMAETSAHLTVKGQWLLAMSDLSI